MTGSRVPLWPDLTRICAEMLGVVMVETSALPLTGSDGVHGELVVFCPSEEA